jgi:adenylate kinase family enzyme
VRKVLIIGSAGSGKSTLAAQLGAALGLPVVHLDALFWQPGWRETPRDVWAERVADLLTRDRWVMDGNYGGTLAARVQAADTVILLALPRLQCLYRVARRGVLGRGRSRPDLNPGCPEQLPDWNFLRYVWAYPDAKLPTVLALLREHGAHKRVVVLCSSAEVHRFLSAIRAFAGTEAARQPPSADT